MKIKFIIVVYNSKVSESLAYKTLSAQNADIAIFDNSDKEEFVLSNSLFAKNIDYISFATNKGLGYAYNYSAIKYADYDYISTCDSDSEYPSDYISTFISSIDPNISIYVPIIKTHDSDKVIAPSIYMNKLKIIFFRKKVTLPNYIGYISTINTGNFIKTDVFNNVKFDERMIIDHSDGDFFDKLYSANFKVKVLDSTVFQTFASFEMGDEFLISGRVVSTYRDSLLYYGKIWYFIAFCWYLKCSIFNLDYRYIKAYINIYFVKEGANGK